MIRQITLMLIILDGNAINIQELQMKQLHVKRTIMSAALIAAAGFSGIASAHDVQGALANIIPSVDVYHTSCFTYSAADAAALGESANAPKRFVGRVAKKCATNNAACGAQGGTVRISIGAVNPIAASTAGAYSSTSTATSPGTFKGEPATGAWTAPASAWAQVANNGPATDKSGLYVVAISHADTLAHNYMAQIHCEDVAVGAAPTPSATNGVIHTGTGITATGGQVPAAGTADADYANDINQ